MIVITGATKGIGKAIADKFAKEGKNLAVCARNEKDLQLMKVDIEANTSVKVYTKVCDVSKKEQIKAFADFVLEREEEIEVLVNNAGFFIPGDICTEEEGTLEAMMETNVYSAYYLSRALVPALVQNEKADIFNICSVASLFAYPNGHSYSISKFAMLALGKGLREELKDKGVRVTNIMPGETYTASWEGVEIPQERFISASDIADMVFSTYKLSGRTVLEDIIIRPQLGAF